MGHMKRQWAKRERMSWSAALPTVLTLILWQSQIIIKSSSNNECNAGLYFLLRQTLQPGMNSLICSICIDAVKLPTTQ